MKTIGYVLSGFPVLSETFIGTEMRSMGLLGHEVVPISITRPNSAAQPYDQSIASETHYLENIGRAQAMASFVRKLSQCADAVGFARAQKSIPAKSLLLLSAKIAYVAERTGCNHLHAHFALHTAAAAITAAKLLKIPVSFVGHGFDIYATPADLALKLRAANFSVAVCKQMQQDFLRLNHTATTELVQCGLELHRFPYRATQQHNGRLLFIGRLTEKKGLTYLFEALAGLPREARPQLDIVGEGAMKTQLEQLQLSLNLHKSVAFLGAKDSQWISRYGASYMALLAPFHEASNGDRDTGPLVLKEAMAIGLPVITTAFMGCPDILGSNLQGNPETGILVPPRNKVALGEAILKMMTMSQPQRQKLTESARARIEHHYSALHQCKILSGAIESCI
ncbi:MAG: glycosyltransferase [Pseudomonadales bacterium]|nr:glycosyltransferase [Pseudomonadales bacterium]